jgi:hypothetical protein
MADYRVCRSPFSRYQMRSTLIRVKIVKDAGLKVLTDVESSELEIGQNLLAFRSSEVPNFEVAPLRYPSQKSYRMVRR